MVSRPQPAGTEFGGVHSSGSTLPIGKATSAWHAHLLVTTPEVAASFSCCFSVSGASEP
jgi:hypothetical protein